MEEIIVDDKYAICPICGKKFKKPKKTSKYCSVECQHKGFKKNLVGEKYGKLTVLEFAYEKEKHFYWKCKCECGNTVIVSASNLKSGITKSCGCYREDFRKKHNLSKTRLYRIWRNMRTRCNNPKTRCYNRYGGRGIAVCDEWLNFENFNNWAINNGYNNNLTIDRIDNNKNYEPSNCRWVTMEEQSQNTNKVISITYNNETHSLSKWARITGMSRHTLYARYKNGWDIEKMLTTNIGE